MSSRMYNLDEVFAEAINGKEEYGTVIRMGVKIQKFKDRIEILNMSKGGSYYRECNDKEYDYFTENGWVIGCLYLAIDNCLHKLSLIEDRIKLEVNTRKNDKHIKKLKNKREDVLLKYASYKLKLKS